MSFVVDNNRRIAKNTLLLYVRMLLIICVSLYTSRVVLNTLGVDDYGIYNVVGSIVVMFSFLNGSMTTATQRYITFAIGRGDNSRLQTIFSTALQIHFLIAVIVIVGGEIIGLWFLYNKLQIPEERMNAAFWVLQCSVISTSVMVLSVPYEADIIAHEEMSAFAYISIFEALLNLFVVYLLLLFSIDKLILYAFLILTIRFLIRFCYTRYCNDKFAETKYHRVWDRQLFREMVAFAGWSVFGNFAVACLGQGLNILLNIFFGSVVNAARGISVQVQSAIQGFVGNFQMALNPQITKTYARGEMNDMHQLMFCSARFSFYLLFLLSLPVLLETEYILTLWLKIVPENTVIFLRIIICTSLISTVSNPLAIANQATGKVKYYQIVCGSILILVLPFSYVCLRLGLPAYSVFLVHLVMEMICMFARMVMLRPLLHIRIREYIEQIHLRIFGVVLVAVVAPIVAHCNLPKGIGRLFIVVLVCLCSICLAVYAVGLTRKERTFIRSRFLSKFNF
jgi:O-antigen/teichoic acid export membrane protein